MEATSTGQGSRSRGFGQRDLQIPADLGQVARARSWAAEAAADFGLDADQAFQVRLAMSEAVTNAIVHGSAGEGDEIEIAVLADGDALVFEVRDVGIEIGVEEHNPPAEIVSGDGTVDESAELLGEGGRGLELVAVVMDEVELARRNRGSVLRFLKRRAA